MIYLFTGVNQLPDHFIDTCNTFLPEWRRDQMMGFRFPADRKLCASGYLMLVYALKNEDLFHELPVFGFNPFGKPCLINYPGIHFNLSHCPDTVVCALSSSEIGIDVESVSEYDDELALAICSGQEYRRLTAFTEKEVRARELTRLWTRKESVVKWLGTGLTSDPKEIAQEDYQDTSAHGYQISSYYNSAGRFSLSVCQTKTRTNVFKNEVLSPLRQPDSYVLRMGKG
ncbi:MAG: 4'-phosphopantetheinyl transferase superfamily protein [Bacteroidales bacterium]